MRNVKVFLVLVLRSAGLHKDLIRALTQRWWFDVESEWLRNERNEMIGLCTHVYRWMVRHVNQAVRSKVPEYNPEEWIHFKTSVRRNINSKVWFRDDCAMEEFMHNLKDCETFQSQKYWQNVPKLDFAIGLKNKKIKL